MSATHLDRVFHERGRLAICSSLVAQPPGATFTQLQDACELTDGNLNRHLHALAEDGIVVTERRTGRGRPQTIVRITAAGRERFLAYIDALEAIVREVQRSSKTNTSPMRTAPARSTSQ
ncbi:MAG TPA: transcriptional regulator [Candidatus Dormibacteraeota bacterium]|nr:transcriptional regulator [Candidatus Dormibacteraeota bacterium]